MTPRTPAGPRFLPERLSIRQGFAPGRQCVGWINWMVRPFGRYLEIAGRSTRREYFGFLVAFAILFLSGAVLDARLEAAAKGASEFVPGGPQFVITMISLVPWFTVQIRRLHDQDRSAWLFIFYLLPGAGFAIVQLLMLVPGTRGTNGYGANPRSDQRIIDVSSIPEFFPARDSAHCKD